MNTTEAFLDALTQPTVKSKHLDSTIRTWRSRANREILSLDFMVEFLLENGYHLKQVMIWNKPDGTLVGENTNDTSFSNNHWAPDSDDNQSEKTELGRKLYAVRKELNKDLFGKWFDWCKEEYTKDYPNKKLGMTTAIFSQMTYGRYISKENVRFAIKTLKEGKRLLSEYEEQIRKELESL